MNTGWGFRHTFATVQLALFVLLTILGNLPTKEDSRIRNNEAPGWDIRTDGGSSKEANSINAAVNTPAFLLLGWSGEIPRRKLAWLWLIPVGIGVWLQWYGVGLWWDRRTGAIPRRPPIKPRRYERVGAYLLFSGLVFVAAVAAISSFSSIFESPAFGFLAWSIFGAALLIGKMRQWRAAGGEETQKR
ncbi:MAG: hypothetical protein ACRD50_04235 [Candidatus Acidiferrales bacterium]